jgi:hypothetical protein
MMEQQPTYQLEGTSHVNKIHVVMCMSTSDITTQDRRHGLFTWHFMMCM